MKQHKARRPPTPIHNAIRLTGRKNQGANLFCIALLTTPRTLARPVAVSLRPTQSPSRWSLIY
jgi:hypothetical protein